MSHFISCGGTRVACNSEICAADKAAATKGNRLRARMKFPMDRFQALLIHVRVNLGRRDVGVAEHLLDDAQISAIAEQMRGKTVS